MYNDPQQLAELKLNKVNKVINATLLLVIILVSGAYTYVRLQDFLDEGIPPPPTPEGIQPLTEEEKADVLISVEDPVFNDEGGMLKVLKSLPKSTQSRSLTDEEKRQILEGN